MALVTVPASIPDAGIENDVEQIDEQIEKDVDA
jgi:hypothetical protein